MEMIKKNNTTLLLTYDYELFLGRSGSVENCLIKPTNALKKIMKAHNAHGTFFVDTVYLLRVKEECNSDYQKIERQLLDLLNDGHRIELHLHPHWVDAKYNFEIQQWFFDNFRYYRVGSCPNSLIESLFDKSVELLSDISYQVDSNYKLFAYRAGGWCIEPFDSFSKLFKKYGIVADSSILPRQSSEDKVQGFDYHMITSSDAYRFTETPLKPITNGCFVEIPVTSFKVSFSNIITHHINMMLKKENYKMMGDGLSSLALNGNVGNHSFVKKLTSIVKEPKWKSLAFEGASYGYPASYYNKSNLFTSITHPKLVTQNSLHEMNRVLGMVDDAVTIKDYVENLVD